MKETELKLIAEPLRNSHRSDRALARALGVSQPTVTRITTKLEKEGISKEYTIVPDFAKLGYTLLAVTFVKLKPSLTADMTEEAREAARKSLRTGIHEVFMLERGIGLDYNGVLLSLHKDYSSYLDLKKRLTQYKFLEMSTINSFLVNLEDEIHYRPLTFSSLARHVLTLNQTKK